MSTHQLFQRVNTNLVPEARIIGNTEGIAMMRELANLHERLNNITFPLRMAVLDDSTTFSPQQFAACRFLFFYIFFLPRSFFDQLARWVFEI
jgi:hypothetical protein